MQQRAIALAPFGSHFGDNFLRSRHPPEGSLRNGRLKCFALALIPFEVRRSTKQRSASVRLRL